MKTKFTKKDMILDDYIRKRYQELLELQNSHEESLKTIRREMKVLIQKKLDLMEFGK